MFEEIRQAAAKGEAVNALCQMTGISRASYYRWGVPRTSFPVEMEFRDQMQKIALEFPAYGYRRITAELNRRSFEVNHKRVLRPMRQDNLLCLRHKAFIVTTDSRHTLSVYPNLARDLVPSGVNQLWVADITYIRRRAELVYLAVLLDAFSRRVIGWALGPTPEAGLALSALGMALRQRRPAPGLVHHSDRGVQYASGDYTDLLKQHKIQTSMSRKGSCGCQRPWRHLQDDGKPCRGPGSRRRSRRRCRPGRRSPGRWLWRHAWRGCHLRADQQVVVAQ